MSERKDDGKPVTPQGGRLVLLSEIARRIQTHLGLERGGSSGGGGGVSFYTLARIVVLIVFLGLFLLIGAPAAISSFALVIDQEGLSAEGGMGLALLAAALAAVVQWVPPKLLGANSTTELDYAKWSGSTFLISALGLTLFAMLAPIVNNIVKDPDHWNWWTDLIRYADATCMMIGTLCLAFGVFLGIEGFAMMILSQIEKTSSKKKDGSNVN